MASRLIGKVNFKTQEETQHHILPLETKYNRWQLAWSAIVSNQYNVAD